MIVSYSDILEQIKEKHEKQQIEVVGKFPSLTAISSNIMLGSFSWYYMQSRRKEILRQFALLFPGVVSTPSEIARSYISLKYQKVRAFREQIAIFKQPITAPLYVQPHDYESGVYVDIRSAYWQILQIVGWDADYYPGVWLAKGEPMDDFPFPEVKLSRNCLVTCGLPSEASFWNGTRHKFERVKTFNKQINLGIWKLIMDVLHCVAWDCIAAGAIYAHTDGYICSSENVRGVQDAISQWGLESRIKLEGETHVYGVGSYSIGKHSTKNPHIQSHAFDGLLLPEYNSWLRKRFAAHALRTRFHWKDLKWESSRSEQLISLLPPENSSTSSTYPLEVLETHDTRISLNGVILDAPF